MGTYFIEKGQTAVTRLTACFLNPVVYSCFDILSICVTLLKSIAHWPWNTKFEEGRSDILSGEEPYRGGVLGADD